ncbi:hypothetical protein ACFLXZ_01255, partial [Chloroflexota bacterium]
MGGLDFTDINLECYKAGNILKILLIEPAKSPLSIGGEDVFLYEPLALEYVSAGVASDHDVRI